MIIYTAFRKKETRKLQKRKGENNRYYIISKLINIRGTICVKNEEMYIFTV